MHIEDAQWCHVEKKQLIWMKKTYRYVIHKFIKTGYMIQSIYYAYCI